MQVYKNNLLIANTEMPQGQLDELINEFLSNDIKSLFFGYAFNILSITPEEYMFIYNNKSQIIIEHFDGRILYICQTKPEQAQEIIKRYYYGYNDWNQNSGFMPKGILPLIENYSYKFGFVVFMVSIIIIISGGYSHVETLRNIGIKGIPLSMAIFLSGSLFSGKIQFNTLFLSKKDILYWLTIIPGIICFLGLSFKL